MDCIMIGIAGGTGFGKSTFTNRLKDRFGDEITVLYHDNYYKRHDDLPFEERKKLNYDHPDALETDLLVEHLKNSETVRASNVRCTITAVITAQTRRSVWNRAGL